MGGKELMKLLEKLKEIILNLVTFTITLFLCLAFLELIYRKYNLYIQSEDVK